jgi:uroporphyrin-III C-methyltransferase
MTAASSTTGSVTLVGGGPGAWDLMTIRGQRALQQADVILTDHLGPAHELEQLCDTASKEIIDVSKLPYGRQVTQEKTNELIVTHALAGRKVVRLKGGDPYVFGRGFEELTVCREHGIPCEVVPGVTSAVSVPAAADIPITQRGLVHSFTVVSGHLPPGHPNSLVDWRAVAESGGTISVIMGVKNAPAIAGALQEVLPADTPAAVIQEGTTDAQRAVRCTLGTLATTMEEHSIGAPAVYVIGEVAGL